MTDSLSSFVEPIRQFVRIRAEIEAAEEALDALKKHRDALADIIIAELATAGIESVPLVVDGQSFNVHMAQPLVVWRKEGVDAETLVKAVKDSEMDWLVKETVNSNTLQAHVRELLADGAELPESLSSVLNIFTKTELRATKATKAETLSKRAARNLKG